MESMRNTRGYMRQNNRILFLGWFIPTKGVYELVDAVGMLLESGYDTRLDFFGTKEVDRLRDYVSTKGLAHSVTVHGWIGQEEKVKALYESTMLVLPSHSEGIPNVILEAMATRTPIVSTLVGGLKEVLRGEENAMIVREKDPFDLSEKIALCLGDRALRERIAERAYREAAEKYDISVVKRNLADILSRMICKGHSRPRSGSRSGRTTP
jgi:glycosyltransferase involved in cell wall biosynthesis